MAADELGHSLSYDLDARDIIVAVDKGWLSFALANDSPHLAPEKVVGRSLWPFLSDITVSHLYRIMVTTVRTTGRTTTVPFRCDAPSLRRFMRLEIAPLTDDGVRLSTSIERLEPRAPVDLLAPANPRMGDQPVRMCSWCKRVAVADAWREVEEAVASLGLFVRHDPPLITHGVCPDCHARLDASFAA